MSATVSSDKQIITLLENQRQVLERIAAGAELADTLGLLVDLIEAQAQGMNCALLLADSEQKRLRFIAAPSVPEDFKHCIEPYLYIATGMVNCGTAAALKRPIYTRDTETDPLWDPCRDVALRNGLRAIWSTPIVSDDGRILGTFSMSYGKPRLPSEEHLRLIDMAVQMARVAIEAKVEEELLRALFEDSPFPLLVSDVAGTIVRANREFARRLGYSPSDLRGRLLREVTESYDTASLIKELVSNGTGLVTDRRYRTRDGAILWARERSTLRRDGSGEPRYLLSRVLQFSEAGADPLDQLSVRERQVLELVIAGNTSKAIAARLNVSPASVDTYRSRFMVKLRLENLPDLMRFAIRHGITSL